ncbi:hypothetical protein ACHAW6_015680 [Cyclotella cf. meneghiniana]
MSAPSHNGQYPQSYENPTQLPRDIHVDRSNDSETNNNDNDNNDNNNNEFSTLVRTSPPAKNCCTRPVAAVFLLLVASALITAWQLFPAEEIAKTYIPKFEAPRNPYTGIEAGAPGGENFNGSDSGFGFNDDLFGEFNVNLPGIGTGGGTDDWTSGGAVPSFMTCQSQECCNGSSDNCILRVDQMMFTMVHNAMATEEGGFFAGFNQYYSLEKALVAGHRGINLDVCNCNGELQFCHNVCDLGQRYPNDVFTNILQFLNDYPSEVIVLLFEASQQGPINWSELYAQIQNVEGFTDKMYIHPGPGQEWPTMAQLVQNDQRIILFYFNGGYCENDVCPSSFHPWFTYAAETQFDSASISELENYEYSCQVTRGPGSSEQERVTNANFFVVNNFVTPPDPDAATTTNSKDFIAGRLSQCANYNDKRPNFIYIDFWNEGVAAELVQFANGQMSEEVSSGAAK